MRRGLWPLSSGALAALVILAASPAAGAADARVVVGRAVNSQGRPVSAVTVVARSRTGESVAAATSRADGWFILELPGGASPSAVRLGRRHYQPISLRLDRQQRRQLERQGVLALGVLALSRHRAAAFWITVAVFVLMMVLIGATVLHNALAALLGASALLATSAIGHVFTPELVIFGFRDAVGAIDWSVVFLIMGMMIVIAVVEGTGVFRWLAYFAYRWSRGRQFRLMAVLMLLSAVASALLDNVTTMLLMTPITIRIAMAIDVDPLALLLPEVLAANVGGLSTMVGTPTNILIASYSGISFAQFLLNLTPGVVLALVGLAGYCWLRFRRQLGAGAEVGPALLAQLEKGATITQPRHLRKAGWVGLGMLVMFLAGEALHIPPAVVALLGATALLVWIRPDVEEMIEAVDWTTLVFFIALFMVVGALQEVGVIDLIAAWIADVVGDQRLLAMLAITWAAALISTVIPNIPFTATMLPVVELLTRSVAGVTPQSLYFCLAVGSAMGGNGSLIGASANLVMAGIAERAGYPVTFGRFFRVGLPALLVTVTLASGWLLVRYLVFAR